MSFTKLKSIKKYQKTTNTFITNNGKQKKTFKRKQDTLRYDEKYIKQARHLLYFQVEIFRYAVT